MKKNYDYDNDELLSINDIKNKKHKSTVLKKKNKDIIDSLVYDNNDDDNNDTEKCDDNDMDEDIKEKLFRKKKQPPKQQKQQPLNNDTNFILMKMYDTISELEKKTNKMYERKKAKDSLKNTNNKEPIVINNNLEQPKNNFKKQTNPYTDALKQKLFNIRI